MRTMIKQYLHTILPFLYKKSTTVDWKGVKIQSTYSPPKIYSYNEISKHIYKTSKQNKRNKV